MAYDRIPPVGVCITFPHILCTSRRAKNYDAAAFDAWYELRTNGPDSTCANPIS